MSEDFVTRRDRWKGILDKWQASGKVGYRWCRENNINQKAFYRWRSFFAEKKDLNKNLSIDSFLEISNKSNIFDFEFEYKNYSLKFKNADFSVVEKLINHFKRK